MQKQLHALVQKEMTRKEFMATIGFGAATIMGFGSLVKLAGVSISQSSQRQQASRGYGSSAYGGSKER